MRPSIIWMDQRSVKQAEHIQNRVGEEQYYKTTGNRVSPTYTISKILWLRENQPAIYERAYKFLQAKEYIIYRLTGKFVTDCSDASLAGMLDVNRREWAYDLLQELEIPVGKLPELFPSILDAFEEQGASVKDVRDDRRMYIRHSVLTNLS